MDTAQWQNVCVLNLDLALGLISNALNSNNNNI